MHLAIWRLFDEENHKMLLVPGKSMAAVAEWYRYRIVACLVTSSSPVPLKTRRVGQRCTLNLSRAETSFLWCGKEDFGKRNMPGKRARRHFSQLSEFERGLIIGMKTADWSTRYVAGQVDRSECTVRNCWEQWTQEGTHARKTGSGATRKTTRIEDRRVVRQALVVHTVIH
ncbi:uncharacterized protein TNCV_3701121 [Trichonephila clavipes]|nr:uncharacterized protein TNCV_3701121 [Trichonephila clavipes]